MKFNLKYCGIIGIFLIIICFFLLVGTNALTKGSSSYVQGASVIFGNSNSFWVGIVIFLFLIASVYLSIVSIVLFVLNFEKTDRVGGVLSAVSSVLIFFAGIFTFMIKVGISGYDNYSIGGGWIIAGICLIVSAFVTFIPTLKIFRE